MEHYPLEFGCTVLHSGAGLRADSDSTSDQLAAPNVTAKQSCQDALDTMTPSNEVLGNAKAKLQQVESQPADPVATQVAAEEKLARQKKQHKTALAQQRKALKAVAAAAKAEQTEAMERAETAERAEATEGLIKMMTDMKAASEKTQEELTLHKKLHKKELTLFKEEMRQLRDTMEQQAIAHSKDVRQRRDTMLGPLPPSLPFLLFSSNIVSVASAPSFRKWKLAHSVLCHVLWCEQTYARGGGGGGGGSDVPLQ